MDMQGNDLKIVMVTILLPEYKRQKNVEIELNSNYEIKSRIKIIS